MKIAVKSWFANAVLFCHMIEMSKKKYINQLFKSNAIEIVYGKKHVKLLLFGRCIWVTLYGKSKYVLEFFIGLNAVKLCVAEFFLTNILSLDQTQRFVEKCETTIWILDNGTALQHYTIDHSGLYFMK